MEEKGRPNLFYVIFGIFLIFLAPVYLFLRTNDSFKASLKEPDPYLGIAMSNDPEINLKIEGDRLFVTIKSSPCHNLLGAFEGNQIARKFGEFNSVNKINISLERLESIFAKYRIYPNFGQKISVKSMSCLFSLSGRQNINIDNRPVPRPIYCDLTIKRVGNSGIAKLCYLSGEEYTGILMSPMIARFIRSKQPEEFEKIWVGFTEITKVYKINRGS